MALNASTQGSKRWTHFHSALQLAIQRCTHKWTFQDFADCFILYVEEERESAPVTFHTVSQHMESQITNDLEQLFKQYSLKENVDILHAVVTEANARKASGIVEKDVWKEDLPPQAAIRSMTIPLLDKERSRLREMLISLEAENEELQLQIEKNYKVRKQTERKLSELVTNFQQIYGEWESLPTEDIESWTVQTAESSMLRGP